MKRAFTIIELLVVIGIVATLIGVLSVTFGRGTESARNAKCLTNMKNLATAVNSYVTETGHYPNAGSVVYSEMKLGSGSAPEESFGEHKGWISWYSSGDGKGSAGSPVSAYCEDLDKREYCITNGAIFKYVAKNRNVYVCPVHENKKFGAAWSYVMNGWFRYSDAKSSGVAKPKDYYIWRGDSSLKRHDRRLLFAELNWAGEDAVIDAGDGTLCDPTLQYKDSEHIGFNHKDGKDRIAHVVFVDGHVEKLRMPRSGMGVSEQVELTKLLCTEKDIAFDGKEYREVK